MGIWDFMGNRAETIMASCCWSLVMLNCDIK